MMTDVFECHEVVDEEDAFALEQFPDGLSALPLDLADLRRAWLALALLVLPRQHLAPVGVLSRHTDTAHVQSVTLSFTETEVSNFSLRLKDWSET